MSTQGPIDMSRNPWDPARFSKEGCWAQLIGGKANGKMGLFQPGQTHLVVPIRPEPSIPKNIDAAGKLFGTQEMMQPNPRECYKLQIIENGGTLMAIGVEERMTHQETWSRLLNDAMELHKANALIEDMARRLKVAEAMLGGVPTSFGQLLSQIEKVKLDEVGQPESPYITHKLFGQVIKMELPLTRITEEGAKLFGIPAQDQQPTKQDTVAPEQDTGDGTFSTSA